MKIAIQGHRNRGNEVIQILESLGGINRMNHSGCYTNYYYYVSGDNNTIAWTCIRPQHLGVFTLEEFEKEFPFKIGDIVTSITTNFRGIIINLKENGYYYVRHDSGNLVCIFGQHLKLYKEMKEERNITLTLEKAKEWYKKGGDLKQIALQAFSEKELNPLPRSWEEFCKNNSIKISEAVICSESTIVTCDCTEIRDSDCDRGICSSIKSAEAHLAMIQLEQLRNCWWNGWEPIWDASQKHVIKWEGNNLTIFTAARIHAFLVFPTREMAEEFLKCFRDLIELAGDLI